MVRTTHLLMRFLKACLYAQARAQLTNNQMTKYKDQYGATVFLNHQQYTHQPFRFKFSFVPASSYSCLPVFIKHLSAVFTLALN